jgi:hypothetical protein
MAYKTRENQHLAVPINSPNQLLQLQQVTKIIYLNKKSIKKSINLGGTKEKTQSEL